ncbi:MAG TPA: hypothetical protein VJ984_15460 [Xanthomonadales bacterium]|nr:hypothetical protein [Xanthomonadales bacterium]
MTDIFWGQSILKPPIGEAAISQVELGNDLWYRIANFDQMPPFLMTVVSAYDHWMYISSSGGLTCGRRDPDGALFPYETDDRIHDACSTAGPLTAFLVKKAGKTCLWKPFSQESRVYEIQRNLYKNQTGNRLTFEEINKSLGLVFSYTWSTSNRFGFVRNSSLRNVGDENLSIRCLDGLRNLLPEGVTRQQQTSQSTLLDAYKRAEKAEGLTAGIYSLSSKLTDRAEPNEALRATLAWSIGLDNPTVLLSEDQVDGFCTGGDIEEEVFSRGKRCAFLTMSEFEIDPDATVSWNIIADVDQGPVELQNLLNAAVSGIDPDLIEQDVLIGSRRLSQLVAQADGFQVSSDSLINGRHFSNTLFNIMRGGVFHDGYQFPMDDFLASVRMRNLPMEDAFKQLLGNDESVPRDVVLDIARHSGTEHLERLALEYLPLKFSRRHGDPSRPWNQFSIDIRGDDGTDRLSYQGNWRDIFQNWEALAISYPEYIESFIAKFINASTADGYNPYRIYKHGIDWEVLEPDEPWSNIGYWGDHQINYLIPLLEFSRNHHPGRIERFLHRQIFVYADVPYRIKEYAALVRNPADTIEFDDGQARVIATRVDELGTDGKLVVGPDQKIIQVTLLEKLLLVVLVRLGNFVPGGGIWMNTQRPEWNDANNALVGFGLSMVTLCYLRRFVAVLTALIDADPVDSYPVSREVSDLFKDLEAQFKNHADTIKAGVDDVQRKLVLDALGETGARHRDVVYAGLSGLKTDLERSRVISFLKCVIEVLDATIRQNKRPDGLYNAYNLIHLDGSGYGVENLSVMLEGQVAVLNSRCPDAVESAELLGALRKSDIYRADQNSYTLYPDKVLPAFLEKNLIDRKLVEKYAWLKAELESGSSRYLERDILGQAHFRGRFRNVSVLRAELNSDERFDAETTQALCDIYETVFNHRAFTGRSGSMCKYEGLGCIYWHMVSKLLLATIDVITNAEHISPEVLESLLRHLDETRDGLGLHKSPADYGAFPTDPYSHTPSFIGVQQPGMTGQVKEDIIVRFRELGVAVQDGQLCFKPTILRRSEFLAEPRQWELPKDDQQHSISLDQGSLAFSLATVPVIYRLGDQNTIQVVSVQGQETTIEGQRLDRKWSESLFRRDGSIEKIVVEIPRDQLIP